MASDVLQRADAPEQRKDWIERTRIDLTPISAPAVLGLFAFGGATWPVAAHMAGWYGDANSTAYLWQFGAMLGGGGQLIAAAWSYRARNALGTGLFGLWGGWWLAWGIMTAMHSAGITPQPADTNFQEYGFWFITMGIVTLFGMVAAFKVNLGIVAVTFCAGTASLLAAAGYMGAGPGLITAAGADFFAAATFAVYSGASIMIEELWGRPLLWIGETEYSRQPSMNPKFPIEYEHGRPGSRVG